MIANQENAVSVADRGTTDFSAEVRLSVPRPGYPPVFVEPVDDALLDRENFLQWLVRRQHDLDNLVVEHGGIVLRGFPVRTTDDFNDLVALFPSYQGGYRGGASPRRRLASRVLESTALASHLKITLHSEMAYTRDYPPRIVFFCRVLAKKGGETIIADLRRITAKLPREIRKLIESKKVRIVRNYAPAGADFGAAAQNPDHLPWDHGLGTNDREEAERLCASMGMQPIWNEDGSLTVISQVEPFATHPKTGRSIYRSTLHTGGRIPNLSADEQAFTKHQAMPTGYYLGDGTPLPLAHADTIKAIVDEETLAWPWRAGDVMILDNLLVAHGRNPFEGEREVQVALLA